MRGRARGRMRIRMGQKSKGRVECKGSTFQPRESKHLLIRKRRRAGGLVYRHAFFNLVGDVKLSGQQPLGDWC